MAYLFDVHLHPPRVMSIGWQDRVGQQLGHVQCFKTANISSITMDPQSLDHIIEVIFDIYSIHIYIYVLYVYV